MMMASMRWASAAAAGACSAVLAASDWACGFGARMAVEVGARGVGLRLVGPDSASDSASVGRRAQRELRSDQGSDRRQPLRATCGRSW